MRVIDGAQGEGGGQVLRTSLALSLLRGEPVKIVDIRAGRARPGLLRQHLTAVNLAARISDAEVEGAEPGSRELIFKPRAVRAGEHAIAVGTAGSTTLVLQTVLPALLVAKEKSSLVIEGGTHNPLAPPFEFLARAFAPLIERMGPRLKLTLERPGFYPGGGGRLRAEIEPVEKLGALVLRERGPLKSRSAHALVAGLSKRIGERELAVLAHKLNWSDGLEVRELPAELGPGNVLHAVIEHEQVTEAFTGFGEKGIRAEAIGAAVADEVRAYLVSKAPAGPHLADQLILPLAMAGAGSFVCTGLTLHARTQLALVRELTGMPLHEEKLEDGVAIHAS